MYVITALLIRAVPNVLPMLVLVVGCVAVSGLLSFCVKKATARFLPPRATLLVYGNPEARKEGEDILRRLPGVFYVLDSISADVGSEELCRQIFRWDARAVMLCGVPSSERNDLLKYCIDRNIEAYVRPNIGDLLVKGARAMQLDNLPVLVCHRSSPAIWYLALKRLTDILLSLAALVVFSPFMLITAIAIKLYDGGPILYKQLRLTKDGKQFYIYKFRSMRVDAEKDGVARLAQEHDNRITPVGKICPLWAPGPSARRSPRITSWRCPSLPSASRPKPASPAWPRSMASTIPPPIISSRWTCSILPPWGLWRT